MTWIYVITWILAGVVPIPCPDYKPDKWGRWPSQRCNVFHCEIVNDTLTAEFTNREEAIMFYGEAVKEMQGNIRYPDNGVGILDNGIISVKFDSVKAERSAK